jgi:hypothetical protein
MKENKKFTKSCTTKNKKKKKIIKISKSNSSKKKKRKEKKKHIGMEEGGRGGNIPGGVFGGRGGIFGHPNNLDTLEKKVAAKMDGWMDDFWSITGFSANL